APRSAAMSADLRAATRANGGCVGCVFLPFVPLLDQNDAVEVRPESPADEITRLRRCVNDLARVLAMPTVWAASERPQSVGTLLDALRGIAEEVDGRVSQHTRDLGLADQALRDSQHAVRLLVDGIPGFIAAFAPDGDLEFANRPLLDFFGTTVAE